MDALDMQFKFHEMYASYWASKAILENEPKHLAISKNHIDLCGEMLKVKQETTYLKEQQK